MLGSVKYNCSARQNSLVSKFGPGNFYTGGHGWQQMHVEISAFAIDALQLQ